MSSTYTIYNTGTGKIERVIQCASSDIEHQLAVGETYLSGDFQDTQFFISDGAPISLPAQPSPHHIFNYTTKQWEDPRTLQDFKDAQWAKTKQARSAAEYAGFTWGGSTFESDAISQNRITGAVTLAQMAPEFTIDWILADNTVRTLSQADMLGVGAALGAHVAAVFAKGVTLRAQIEAATTPEAVEGVVW